jgi:hypothetical protein
MKRRLSGADLGAEASRGDANDMDKLRDCQGVEAQEPRMAAPKPPYEAPALSQSRLIKSVQCHGRLT